MNQSYIIYTAGEMAVTIKKYAQTLGIKIIGFYDNNLEVQGKKIENLKVFNSDELKKKVQAEGFGGIIIGSQLYENQIIEEIKTRLGDTIKIIKPDEIQSEYWDKVVTPFRNKLKETYEVCYSEQIKTWIYNLMSEVEYWIKSCRSNREANFIRYSMTEKDFKCDRLLRKISSDNIIIDAGCGICTKYGKIVDGKKLNLIPMDPLAYFYNAINNKIYATENRVIFGLFEFLSFYFEYNFADIILIDNALDHCIDPFKSIIECLLVIKPNGMLSMRHRRGEAVYEGYSGLHKWNIDINQNGEFIIWNKSNMINISKKLIDVADIDIHFSESNRRVDQYLDINIIKKKDFDKKDFFDIEQESKMLAEVISKMMMYFADEKHNLYFQSLLKDI